MADLKTSQRYRSTPPALRCTGEGASRPRWSGPQAVGATYLADFSKAAALLIYWRGVFFQTASNSLATLEPDYRDDSQVDLGEYF